MSRSINPYVSGGSAVNFGVTSRPRSAQFVDTPLRSGVIQAVNLSTTGTIQVSQLQSDMILVSPSTGSGGVQQQYILPSAADLLQAFHNSSVGTVIRLNVANKGSGTANFKSPAGSGQTATTRYQSVNVGPLGLASLSDSSSAYTGYVRQAVGTIHIEFDQINGLSSNTGINAGFPSALATGSYLVY